LNIISADSLAVIAILDEAAELLVAPDWEWLSIGDNNILAWQTAERVARVTGLSKQECFNPVATSLHRRWEQRFQQKDQP
jgi:hypothetical protein